MRKAGKTNIRFVAQAAGVSPATASRALNGSGSVSEELTQRVFSAARELGYPISGGFKGKKTIAFIMPGVCNTYYSKTLTGVFDVVQPAGYRVQILLSGSEPEQELACLREACNPDTAGIIIAPITDTDPRQALPGLADIPMVVTGPRHLTDGPIHVYLDHDEAAYQGTRYLLRLGRKKIAFVVYSWTQRIQSYEALMEECRAPHQGCFTTCDAYSGYCRALDEAGLQPNPSLLAYGGMSYESGRNCARQLLCSDTDFDAVIVPNDRCGAGMMNALQAQGFHVPSQVSLVCLDSDLIAKVVSPTLTSMASANYELGQQCAYQLMHLINGEPAHNVVLEPKLLIENSTQFNVGRSQ